MSKVEEDLIFASKLIEDKEKCGEYFTIFNHLWPFATVNIREYLAPYNLEGKICVTLQGSSDHIFELALKNPKEIIGFDINTLTGYYGNLKIAAVKALNTPEEYLAFFRNQSYAANPFDKKTFQAISQYLEGNDKIFWEELFNMYSSWQIRENLFSKDEGNQSEIKGALNYITPENYKYLKNNLKNINLIFMNTDIKNLASELPYNVDFLTLSNLILYAHNLFPENTLENWEKLIEKLALKLNKNGHIIAGYFYDIENEEDYRDMYNKLLRDKVFNSPSYSYHLFTKMTDLARQKQSYNHDATLIYTK